MHSISTLIKSLPSVTQARIVSSGYAVWLVWAGDLNSAVPSTMKDYGAFLMAKERHQALWFAPDSQVLRSVARLQAMSRLNDMPLLVQVFPVTFLVAHDLTRTLSIAAEFTRQQVNAPDSFEAFIHPKLVEQIKGMPGIMLTDVPKKTGLVGGEWKTLDPETSVDFEAKLKWYFVIKPLGKLSDRDSIIAWRDYYSEIQEILQNHGLKYISDVKEGFVIVPLEDQQTLKTMSQEMLRLVQRSLEDSDLPQWPCVMAAVPQENLPFSVDLPSKVGLDWNKLTPDVPHMRFRDGFLMEEWFVINEVRYGTEQDTLKSWCNIGLKAGDAENAHGTLHMPLPPALLQGEQECFYCGLKNHTADQCPSRSLSHLLPGIWTKLAEINFDDLVSGYDALGATINGEDQLSKMESLLESGKKVDNLLARALFEINSAGQLRQLQLVWRARGKEWPEGFANLAPEEGEYIWHALSAMRAGEVEEAVDILKQASMKYQRSYQPHSLLGFLHMELGDHNQAQFHWEECERLSFTPLQQGYFHYLKARSLEVTGEYKTASSFYRQAYTTSPKWLDPLYRQAVCMVKMGFTSQAFDIFTDLIRQSPHMFNRVLIDPELDRGRVHIMSMLWERWTEAENEAEASKENLQHIVDDVSKRFDSEHKYFEISHDKLERMHKLAEIKNYVPYRRLSVGIEKFRKEYDDLIVNEIKRANSRMEYYSDRLREIQREAAWFPFPKLLLEFNRDFNYCVEKINWIRNQHLKVAENYRTAQRNMQEIEDRLQALQGRLVTLRIVRDATLYILLLGRNFVWFEIVGLGIALITVPAIIYFSGSFQGNMIIDMILKEKWEFQKGLVIILSIVALLCAALRSALVFEKKKQDLFDRVEAELAARRKKRSKK